MSLAGEVDPYLVPYHWHWLMFPLIDLLGPELVYTIGIKALEYPPTWVDLPQEAALVEAAVTEYLLKGN